MSGEPMTEEEFIVHALNIHGDFFERRCQDIIWRETSWKIGATKLPVAVEGGHQSELDILAEQERSGRRHILLIECKKHNPEFVKWVFFQKDEHMGREPHAMFFPGMSQEGTRRMHNGHFTGPSVVIMDVAREVRGNYLTHKRDQDKTKTANNSITDAARQIALATQSLWMSESNRLTALFKTPPFPSMPASTIIMPIIVTTAQLFRCDFLDQDIDITTGIIPKDKCSFEEQPFVVFEYGLPEYLVPTLQARLPSDSDYGDRWRDIVVVNSASFQEFLSEYAINV